MTTATKTAPVPARPARSYAAQSATSPLAPHPISRREPLENDVAIEILYCGVCHSDLHLVRDEWSESGFHAVFPVVPGHEIVGRATHVGKNVKKFKVGDLVAVGCMVDSCRGCANCKRGMEQYCEQGMVLTYNSPDKHLGGVTYGGYSDRITVDEAFVLRVAGNLDPAATAPLLCAGITTYSPLHHWKAGPGKRVGIVGLGGLGHMGVKFARAMGAHVTVFTTSPNKKADAERLGAHDVVVSTNAEQMRSKARSFDMILDTVSANHDVDALIALLNIDGTLAMVGAPPKPVPVTAMNLIFGRRSFAGSAIGGIAETQEMLDFCSKHKIVSDIELIDIKDINKAYERLLRGDVKYRFVIDMASLKR